MQCPSVCQEKYERSELEARTVSPAPSGVPDNDLQVLLKKLVARYGTQSALADAIGLTDSRLTKVLRGDSGGLGVLNCLRLAKVAGVAPSTVLRAAGKGDIADLIEDMYGKSATPLFSVDRAVEEWWPDLSPPARAAMRTLLDELAGSSSAGKRKRR